MSYAFPLSSIKENLVPFRAKRVASSCIWCAPDVGDEHALLNACSYLIDPDDSTSGKQFHAERYGGSGLQRNGGGARCGINGHYQVKGIGANPLVGKGSDSRHSDGALGATHAIYEALWSEVLAKILPFGAVRTQAVLLTDRRSDNSHDQTLSPSRRALLIREPVIRPAHFERAPYFRPQSKYVGRLMHDAQRVKSVIRKLPLNLPTPQAGYSKEADRDLRIYCIEGLCELARRQAIQMAFCRTRFLRLTTSPSNIAIDGRVLDFNGLSCLFPGDQPYDFGYKLRLKELIKEPTTLQQGLFDICLYLGKYVFDHEFTSIGRQQVREVFQMTFEQACTRANLELIGIPGYIFPLDSMHSAIRQLQPVFIKLYDSCPRTMRLTRHDAHDRSLMQRLVLSLIRRSQRLKVPGEEVLEQNIYFADVLRCFNQLILEMIKSCEAQAIDASPILNGMEGCVQQKLQSRKCLSKVYMFKEITMLLESHGKDMVSLRLAISEMSARMQGFAIQVLGR